MTVCTTLAMKLKHILGENDIKPDEEITNNNTSNKLIDKYVKNMREDEVLLKTLHQLILDSSDENSNLDKEMARKCVDKLRADLSGKEPTLDLSQDLISRVSKNEHLIRSLVDIVSENNVPKKEIKVLEMNTAGGGSLMAHEVDAYLASAALYPIDVGYSVAVRALNTVPDSFRSGRAFKLMEWSPEESPFPCDISPKDLVIARDSEDLWPLDMESHLQEVHDVLVEQGFLMTVFRTRVTPPELMLAQLLDLKTPPGADRLAKRVDDYTAEARKMGFRLVGRKDDSVGSAALLFRKVTDKGLPDKHRVINIDTNCEKWFDVLREKLVACKDNDEKLPLWLVGTGGGGDGQTSATAINGIIGLVNCLRLEPGGDCIRCLFDSESTKSEIDIRHKPYADILAMDLAVNVLSGGGRVGTYRHLTLHRDYDRFASNNYFLNVTQNKDLSSLQWFDSKQLVSPIGPTYDLSNNQINNVRCDVYCAGLNFRDVMFATGRIAAGPQSLFMDCLIGFEFAGRRADNGERVCGFTLSRSFATEATTNDRMVSHIPDHWSMEEAVTVLSTYSTVWYGLIKRANLMKGERILIHSGAGGVGQAAISICQYYGCDIYCTVGTDDKKRFLMAEYGVPESRIYSSRDIQFKYAIKQATGGKGVNLVLNSLTGDKLEASYDVIADCGRFVEIGKYDLQMNKQLGMFTFLRDVAFIGVSVDMKLYLENGFTDEFFEWMHRNSRNGCVRPINRTVFPAAEAEKAFRYMTTGKHIGKILLRMRDEEQPVLPVLRSGPVAPAGQLTVTGKTYFDPNKSYVIVGGLGGFGVELAHWMITLGARRLVLVSRSGARHDYQRFVIRRLEAFGQRLKWFDSRVTVSTADCRTTAGARQLLAEASALGPVGGVFHLALVLNDCLIENQTYDKFAETVDSKTRCCAELDAASRALPAPLDYFVVFSSVSCGKGNAGQSNYGYGNSVCERICERRRAQGLAAQAIQWGPIDDVGVIADSDKFSTFSGVVKQRINSCLEILDKLLQSDHPIVSCVVRAKRQLQSGTREARIVAQIWMALGIDPNTTPDHLTLGEIGMESMFAVEFQQ
ncbi:unnamed protein product, partial [Medioppia subpectinata]